jgi:hypothetical protein
MAPSIEVRDRRADICIDKVDTFNIVPFVRVFNHLRPLGGLGRIAKTYIEYLEETIVSATSFPVSFAAANPTLPRSTASTEAPSPLRNREIPLHRRPSEFQSDQIPLKALNRKGN